jgi:hypothetical protein
MIPLTTACATLLLFSRPFPIAPDAVVDVVTVFVDQALDLPATRARLRARVRDCAAKADIIANEILALWIRERVLDVSLLHLEMSVDIPTVVCLSAFRHLLMLRLFGSASSISDDVHSGKPQAFEAD